MKQWKKKLIYPLFAVACVLFAVYATVLHFKAEDTPPVINGPQEPCALSVDEMSDEALLWGMSATDKEDGDLTGQLMVESVSKFFESGRCRVTYVVTDSANHVTKRIREVVFTDYTPPHFSLSAPLVFSSSSRFVASDNVQVTDCLDGDLSDAVKMKLMDATASIYTEGVWPVSFRVSNSKGDTRSLTADVTVLSSVDYNAWKRGPQVGLSTWLVYVENGEDFNPMAYLSGVTYEGQQISAGEAAEYVTVSSLPDTALDGVYTVKYEFRGASGSYGWTQLVVVVGEGA